MHRLLALVALLPAVALATSMRAAPLEELVQRADLAVVGRAIARASVWQNGRIVTRVTVEVHEVWSGAVADSGTVEVVTLGGVVGNLGQTVAGSPVIVEGERVALLLTRAAGGDYHPLGMWQGVFHVAPEGVDPLVSRAPAAAYIVGPLPAPFPATLSGLRAAVLEAVRGR